MKTVQAAKGGNRRGVAAVLKAKRVPDDVDRAIGLKLRILRTSREMSQSELGRLVGVSYQQLQKYENGENRLSMSTFCRLTEALRVSPVELLPEGHLFTHRLKPKAWEVAFIADQLPENFQDALIVLAKSLVGASSLPRTSQ